MNAAGPPDPDQVQAHQQPDDVHGHRLRRREAVHACRSHLDEDVRLHLGLAQGHWPRVPAGMAVAPVTTVALVGLTGFEPATP